MSVSVKCFVGHIISKMSEQFGFAQTLRFAKLFSVDYLGIHHSPQKSK